MAASIATTTTTDAVRPTSIAITANGVKWACFDDGSTIKFYYNNGGGWTEHTPSMSLVGGSRPDLFIDKDDYAHFVHVSGSAINYYRGTPNGARTDWTWSAAQSSSYGNNAYSPRVVAHPEGTGWKAHITYTARNYWESGQWWYRCRCTSGGPHGHTTCASWGTTYRDCTCYTGVCQGTGSHFHLSPSDDIANGCYAWPTQPGYNAAGIGASSHTHTCTSGVSDSYFESYGSGYDTYILYRRYNISAAQAITSDTHSATESIGGSDTGLKTFLDFAHTGDGKTPMASPHLYVGWNANSIVYRKRFAYTAGAWSSSARIDVATGVTERAIFGAWNGTAFIMAYRDPALTTRLQLRSVDDGGTVTILASTPVHPSTVNRTNIVVGTNNIYSLVNNGTDGVWLSTYDGAWSAYRQVVVQATTLAGWPDNFAVNPHLVSGSVWFAYEVGAGSPYTVWEHTEAAKAGGGWGLMAVGG